MCDNIIVILSMKQFSLLNCAERQKQEMIRSLGCERMLKRKTEDRLESLYNQRRLYTIHTPRKHILKLYNPNL